MATEAETKEPISESPSDGATTAIDNSSIANETTKDEALCKVAVGTLDSSKGESLVEAPEETVSKHAEIVTAELKNEGDLTSNGNNSEAKGKKVITAKEVTESGSSDVNVMAIYEVKATDESASQNRMQQKDQDQDNNIVHVQVTKFDMEEASEAQVEDKEDEGTTDIEKLEVNEDNIKKEAENGMLSDDSTNSIYNTPAVEPFETKNSREPPEIMNEHLEPADKFESPTVAVLEEPDVETFERVIGGEQVKVEAETGIFNDERTNVIDSISVAEPSEEGSAEESLEKTSKEELEPAEGEQEHDKPESFQEPEKEKHKRVNEDDIKIEAETEICADKRIDDADIMSVAEPSDKEIEQEPPEITAKDGPEPAKEKPEHGKLESSLDALPDEPEDKELERVNEDMNVKAEAKNGTRDDERTKEFEPEHEKLEKYLDAVTGEPEEELERAIEDKKIKMEAETEICADERTTDADSTSVAEPLENENIQEPIEITVKEAHESAEDAPEHSERESTLDAVLEKTEASMLPDNGPDSCGLNRNHENVTTNKEDLVMNVEECSQEDNKEYEPIETDALNLLPEYESTSVGGAAATDNCSISHDTAKEEAFCTVAVGTLDSSDGEIIVEAPKETVSEELKNEGDLTSIGDNTEAKDEKVIAAKELTESESSDVNVMAIDKERATDERASQDILHQKDQDDNIVHAQAKNFDMVEASEALAEDKEDEGATDIEKLEVNGDNIKKEAENGMLSDESSNGIDNTPAAEPLEKKNSKEPHEIMNKDLEPADKLQSPIDAVPEEPDVEKLERVNEDEHVKVEAETGIFNDERSIGIESISVEEPSEKGNTQESLEKTSKEELEAAGHEPEHDKLKSFPEPEEEKLGRVNEDNVKIEGEPENCADERIDDADSMSVVEPSDKEIKQESLEISVKEDPEPETAKDEPEHGKLKSSLDPVAHELEEKELKRIIEDKNVKVEAESGVRDDKRTNGIDSTSTAEPSDKENRQEPLAMTAKENLEPEKDEPEHEKHEKSLDAVTEEPEEKLERVIEDKKNKMEAETEICDDERTADAESTPVLEPSENENRQKPLEITAKEDLEPAEDVSEHSERESSLDAVLQQPEASMLPDNGPESSGLNRNHENETTSKEDLVMTLEECSLEDGKKYEPVEKEAFNFHPEYESPSDGTLDSSKGESLVEAPKETVSKHAEIVTAELKNEGDLTSNGNDTEAKGKKVIRAKEVTESGSSDVNVMAIDEVKATDESASQNRMQQKDRDQDNNIVHVQVTKFDMEEASEAQVEDKEDEGTTDIEKLEVNEDNIKKEAENGLLSDDSTNSIYNTPAVEPFEMKNSKEPLEIMNEDLEPADKFESPTVTVLEEPDVEKFESVIGGEQVKVEAETGIFNDERTNVIDSISVAEPSEEGSAEESLEKTSKEELEPAEGEQEHDKPESFQEPEKEKHKRVNEDDIKIEAETEICADKRIDDADIMSVGEPSDKEIEQEPPEITAKDGPEPAKEKPEHGKLESSLDALPDEPEDKELERVNEDMNVKAEPENGTRDDERTKEFEPEHEKLEKYLDAVTGEPEEELERAIEDMKIKMEAETEICADERTTDADSTSVAEPLENENIQEPIEITVKEAHESAEDAPEHSERKSTLDAVLEKTEASMLPDNGPDSCGLNKNHEIVTTNKKDLVMNVEECSQEDNKEYEPIETDALNLLPEYESTSVGGAAATDNCSISHDTAKEEAFCTVAVGTLDSSDGEIIVEAPKETVSEELKNEGDLTSIGDNTEAKDEKVIAAKELTESESSDVNVMAIDKERATDERASQDILHQKDQDDNIVHAQAKNFDMVEASEALAEDKEDEGATDIEKLEVNGDNIKKEAENGMLSDESSNGIDNTPAAEPLEKKNSKEPHEIMNKDLEPADKLQSPIDAVPEEPDVEKLERVNEDEHVKVEAETGIFNDERSIGIESISVEEPSEKGNTQESLEKTSKEELEAAGHEPEHDKLKSFPEPEEEKLGRVNEDNVKIEGEPENCADERIDDADSMSVVEPSDKEIKQESLEISVKEDPEPETAKDEPEHGKLKSSLDPVAHELEEKELKRIIEDKNVKVEAESGVRDDKRTNGIDSTSTAEPSDKENRQEPLEMTAKENLEPEKDEPEHEKLEKSLDAVTEESEEKLERVIEDKKIKMEAETEICDDERTADAESTPVLEPSENENRQKPLEITAKEDLEPAEDVSEHSEPESSLDAVLQKPEASMLPDNGPESSGLNRNHENETTSKEDLVMTLEECSLEDGKKYEPVEKEAFNFHPEYELRDDDRNDSGEELEKASNLICENQARETVNGEGYIEVSNSKEKAPEEFKLVSEIVPELKSQETWNETEGTQIEKSNFDENSSDKSPSDGATTAIDSSIANETAKDEALCTVAVGTLDSSKGESLVEAPKETVSKHAEIVSAELKNEGDLTSNGNDTEAKGKKVITAKEVTESGSPDVNVMAIDEVKATDESASQNRMQQKDQDQDNNIVHVQVTKFDMEEASEAQVEDKEDEGTTDIEKLEVNEDNLKREAENGMLSDDSTDSIYNTPAVEPFEMKNSKEPPEIMNEDLEPADKFGSPTVAVHEEPDVEKFERVNGGEQVKVEAETGIFNDERTNVIDSISVAEPSEEGSAEESLEKTSKEELEPVEGEQEHDKPESFQEPEEEKHKRVNEDDIKIEAETAICADKRIDDADSMPVAEPSDKVIEKEPPEITAKDGPEPVKENPEHGKLESSLDALPDEPEEKELERVNEDMNVKAEAENRTRDDEKTKEFEPEHEKLEKYLDAVTGEPEEELERVIEDKKIKMEAETEICADERTTDADSTSVAEPSEKENIQERIEITVKEAHESAEDVPEHSERESTLGAVLEKTEANMLPDNGPYSCGLNKNHENVTTNKEDLVMNVEECSLEDDKECEPIEKEALDLLPEYEITMVDGSGNDTEAANGAKESSSEYDVVKGMTYGGSEIHEGTTVGMGFCKEQKVTEKLDSNNELEQGKELSVAVEENAADETLESAVQKENWEEKLEGPSKVVSGKTILAEESTFIQEGEKEDPSERHEECFVEKDKVVILGQAESRMDTEDQNSKPENIHVGNDKPEEIPNPACEEQRRETINGSIGIEIDDKERELSQKLELMSNSVAEDKNQEIIRQKDFDVSTNDCILLNMISEIVKKNDDKENMEEANLSKAFDDCCDSHVSIEETINNEVGQKKEDGSSSANEDQNYQATDTTDKLEVHVSEEKDIQHKIFQVSLPEDRCQNETGESDAIKIDNSTNDDSKTMMPGAADLNNDAETAKEKDEENLNTAKEDCSDDHTSIAPIILPDQISEHEDSSKTEHGEQIYLVINDECSIEVDIHKETVDPEEFENITESIPKDHNQGDVNEPKSTDNSDNTDHLDKAIPGAADCEDNKEASMQERKENLDINMELGPEDLRQDVICETESVKVEKELNIDENEKNSAVRTEYTTDATSGAKLEKMSVEDSYELESDDKQENTNMFVNRKEEMPKEETAGHVLEKTLSTVNINTTEDISENQIEGKVGANNANSENMGCEQNQATVEEIPEVANRDQNKERYDSTKNGTTNEEVKVSDTADVAKNLTETVEVQISEDASQVMKADSDECQDYEENDECKENTSTSQMLEKSVRNENEEKTNEIHDDLPVSSTPSDEATNGNLHKNKGEKATKEGYGIGDDIPNQEANKSYDGDLKDKGYITISDDNVSDIPALEEETGQVENAHQKAADSSYGEQIRESISISEGTNLDALIIQNKTEQKSYKSNGASESNENVSFNQTTENDSEKEKLEDLEPEKFTHAVIEDIETTTGAEGIHENETNNESTKHKNEENFLKDRDMKLLESAIELEPDQQSNKSIYPAEGASPSEETLNVKDLVDDVEAHNEEKHCRNYDVSVAHNLVEESTDMEGEEPQLQKHSMELEIHGKTEQNDSIVAQSEEIAERSETFKLHKDTKELIEQSSNTLLGNQEIAIPIENIDKNIMPDKDAAEADLEQIPDDETEAKENSEQVTDTVPNDEVKEDNHQTSRELVMGSTENLITSADTASQAEETKQEVGEQFSKISDYWPRGYNEEASMVSTVDAAHPKETTSVVEQPEAEQIKHTSTDSTAACEIEEQGTEVYVPEDSGLDTIDKERREELKEDSDSMPKEVVKKIGSSVELTEDRENPHEESTVKEPQVDQPDVVTETEELTDKAGHEVEGDHLQEEKKQTGLGELPVSQFLMKYILQEGDALNETRDGEYEDVSNKKNGGDKQNEGKIPKQEDKSAPLSAVQLTEEASTPEDKVGSEKLDDSSESVQAEKGYEEEGYEGKENSDITAFKDGPSLQSTLDETTSLVVTEDGKDEVDILSSEMSNNIARDESMEVNSTEQNSQGSSVNNDNCKPDLVQDEKIKGTVLEETLTQEEIQKDNETLDKEVDASTVSKTSEKNNLQGEESKECLQDVVKAEGSYEVSDGQSTMDDSEYGEILEIKSEIEKAECGDEKQEVGNQAQILKNDSTEELTLSEPQIIQQTGLVNEAKIHALETTEKFMEDKNSEIILDRNQMVETKVDENKADEEKHEKEEKEEIKPEKSSSNAAIVETKESELKPIQKCEQTRKSSESSTTEDHEHEETLQLLSEFKIAGSGEKKQDVINQNQVQTNNGLNEEENLSDSATQPLHVAEKLEEQSTVANVDENHAVQITETKVDDNKAGDVKNEKAEEEEDEHNPEESGQNSTINVEARDAELKPTPKKSHGLLSGVGSKVKHSIAKVKKAITGKSSHSKTVSAK